MIQLLEWELKEEGDYVGRIYSREFDKPYVTYGNYHHICPICSKLWMTCTNRTALMDWSVFMKICSACGDGRLLPQTQVSAIQPPTLPYRLLVREFLLYTDPDFGKNFRSPEHWHTWRLPV